MTEEKTKHFQRVKSTLAMTSMTVMLGFLASCANSFDQTTDIYAPTSNMARLAVQMHAQGDDEGAAEFYQRALQQDPGDVPAHKGLADIFESHGDYASAAGQYHALIKLRPDDGEFLRSYGRILIKLNRPGEAKDQYEAALRLNSDDIKARNGIGIALDYLGNHRAAQEQYKKALDQKSDDLPTLSNLAHSYVLAGRYEEAIKLLEPQCRNASSPPALRQNLAEAYALAGMDVDAERVARMDLPPEDVKKNLAYYHAERVKMLPPSAAYADLGGLATHDLAEVRADKLKEQFAKGSTKLIFEVVPEVKQEGGTPQFFIHVHGFAKPAAAAAFCDKLKAQGVSCAVGK